jgi:mono/diheme cytochrome c family protein
LTLTIVRPSFRLFLDWSQQKCIWSKKMPKFKKVAAALGATIALSQPAKAQSADPTLGRNIAETTCSVCHQIRPGAAPQDQNSKAPSFVDVSRMPSTNELAIKVFLRSSHPTMPNIMLNADEIDSLAAYIVDLAKK